MAQERCSLMNRIIKYISLVILSVSLCIFLHVMTPPAFTNEIPKNTLSACALLLGIPLTALLWAVIAYSCVAFVFYLIEDKIPGEKGSWGFRYGFSVGILWLLGYVMCMPKFGNPFINEFIGGLCDATPAIIMGWLLGLFTSQKVTTTVAIAYNKTQLIVGVIVFVLFFSIARIGSYYMNIIDTGFQVNSVYTLAWTIVMGCYLGIMYVLLGKTITSSSALVSAMKFGFLLFGLTWGSFIMFFPLMLKGELSNTVIMFLLDSLSVATAYYFSEILLIRSQGARHLLHQDKVAP